jgi:ribulose bisphosphate carboxylase small subunit
MERAGFWQLNQHNRTNSSKDSMMTFQGFVLISNDTIIFMSSFDSTKKRRFWLALKV